MTLEQLEAVAHAAKVLGVKIETEENEDGWEVTVNRPFSVMDYRVACGQLVGTAAAKAGV